MAADALEQSVLEAKDREQLMAIASALGVKSTSRAKKADLIQKILETTGAIPASGSGRDPVDRSADAPALFDAVAVRVPPATRLPATRSSASSATSSATPVVLGADGEPLADWEIELLEQGISTDTTPLAVPSGRSARPARPTQPPRRAPTPTTPAVSADADADADPDGDDGDDGDDDGGNEGDAGTDGDGESRNRRRRRRRNKNRTEVGPDGEPTVRSAPVGQPVQNNGGQNSRSDQNSGGQNNGGQNNGGQNSRGDQNNGGQNQGGQNQGGQYSRGESGQSSRNDQGGRNDPNIRTDRPDRGESDAYGQEPVQVSGYLDLRDEGYGFLRVNGYLASRDDAYIPVKLTRQFGLRKGDHVTGMSRPAARNEKNPALLEVHTINGGDPDAARSRPRFEDLTPLFPDTKLTLENPGDDSPAYMTARIIDLISPIGLGQRGLIVAPPKAGKTTIMKTIATAIERSHPEVKLIVLLIDERPEEVTDMRRTVTGEVIASTFDRPNEEHTHLAEMCIERAKRLVEQGDDVVIILDGITRLSRAYNLVAPSTGHVLSGGIDAGAFYSPKKFFGAARNVEEGGSLTILATALVETNSRMDDAIFDEFTGHANMELRLDRHLAERRIYPAINVDASSTQHEELLFTEPQLAMVWKLRRVVSGLAEGANPAPGLEHLIARLKQFRTNDEFLAETSEQPNP